MAQVKLKCVLDDCDHETVQLDFDQARSMLDLHMKYAHPTGGASGGDRKPEKFPRPEIKLDSSAEDWSEFLETWKQYKEEYALGKVSKKKKSAEFSALFKTHPPHSQSAEKNNKNNMV